MTLTNAFRVFVIACLGAITLACKSTAETRQNVHQTEQAGLTITTWNVEHLAFPFDTGCTPRDAEEFGKLQAYASGLKSDIVALQEVASVQAVAQLFPQDQWQIVLSQRPDSEPFTCRRTGFTSTQQKVAFAVRKGIAITNVQFREEFGLEMPGLRHGLEITVESAFGPLTLLNLHMKSGCFVDNYERADSEACQIFAQQVPVLKNWFELQIKNGFPYVVLGDFNHRLSAPYNQVTRQLEAIGADTLVNTTADVISCHPFYPAPIDHIWVGNLPSASLNKDISVHYFDDMDRDAMLSDHCAISLQLSQADLPLSNAVKWQTKSKEYKYLTRSIYQQATHTLNTMPAVDNSWVVVMDIDETVLDNSAYQVQLDRTGATYTSASWANWVASEQATLVPGAKAFIQAVLAKGGKLALITNRNREQDRHTWNNLLQVGLAVNSENTCLMGRTPKDKTAINGKSIKNDKDLRRSQIKSGEASCYNSAEARSTDFGKQQIAMQVGDNIEDFLGVVQHKVNVSALLSEANGKLVLLPNPMYGSWH